MSILVRQRSAGRSRRYVLRQRTARSSTADGPRGDAEGTLLGSGQPALRLQAVRSSAADETLSNGDNHPFTTTDKSSPSPVKRRTERRPRFHTKGSPDEWFVRMQRVHIFGCGRERRRTKINEHNFNDSTKTAWRASLYFRMGKAKTLTVQLPTSPFSNLKLTVFTPHWLLHQASAFSGYSYLVLWVIVKALMINFHWVSLWWQAGSRMIDIYGYCISRTVSRQFHL